MKKKKAGNVRINKAEEEKKKRIDETKKKIIKFILVLIVLLMVSYFIFVLYRLIKNPTDKFLVENGKIFLEEQTQGYIIREETVIKGSNYKNGMEKIALEGERVAKNEPIYRYYVSGEENITKEIQELDVKIQEAMSKETDLYNVDIRNIDKQIEIELDEISEINDIQRIAELKKDINNNITKKAAMIGELSPAGSYIKTLRDERNALVTQLYQGSEYVKAEKSGIVSYRIDGLEETLNTGDFTKITKSLLEGFNLKTGQVIPTNEESGKIINNFYCYISCILYSDEAKKAEIGDKIKIRLTNLNEINAEIICKTDESDGSVVLTFRIDDAVEDLIGYRKISVDVIWWSSSGLKVPNSSIIEKDGKSYVIRERAGYQDKILIKVVDSNSKNSIIENYETEELKELGYTTEELKNRRLISLYDQILLEPHADDY